MLSPRRVKFRKQHKGRMSGKPATRGASIAFGDYALIAMEPGWITARQIEAARIAINRYSRREGQLFLRIFPDKPISQKPLEVRMGKGKGAPEYWVSVVQPGRVLYELDGVSMEKAKEAFRLASHKLPIKTKFIHRGELV